MHIILRVEFSMDFRNRLTTRVALKKCNAAKATQLKVKYCSEVSGHTSVLKIKRAQCKHTDSFCSLTPLTFWVALIEPKPN